jgi:probable rRNA maturation factor
MRSNPSTIYFHFLAGRFSLTQRTRLKAFIKILFKKEGYRIDTINYIFCNDAYLLEINKTYLKHHTLTDIITFPLYEKGSPISSDIYISVDRVKENAKLFGVSFKEEIHRVIFHGALHLCGYKDKSKGDSLLMRQMEEKYLSLYFVPRETKGV